MAKDKRIRVNIYHGNYQVWTINMEAKNANEAIVEAYKHFVRDDNSVLTISHIETGRTYLYE